MFVLFFFFSLFFFLCFFQHIYTLQHELLDEVVMGRLHPEGIDIHAGDPGVGKFLFQELFDPFGPKIAMDKFMITAGGTGVHRRIYSTAIMTMQLIRQLMKVQ